MTAVCLALLLVAQMVACLDYSTAVSLVCLKVELKVLRLAALLGIEMVVLKEQLLVD